jgi:hypothetical protein
MPTKTTYHLDQILDFISFQLNHEINYYFAQKFYMAPMKDKKIILDRIFQLSKEAIISKWEQETEQNEGKIKDNQKGKNND